jgi:hypothetical protein
LTTLARSSAPSARGPTAHPGELYILGWNTTAMDPFLIWLEATSLSTWIRDSPSVFAFPTILSLHTVGMGLVAGLSAAIALRILGVASQVPSSN